MKKIILSIILVLVILIFVLPGFLIPIKIECQSQYGKCTSEVVKGMVPLEGKKMHYAKRHLKKELESNFLISEYTIQFKLPNILSVNLTVKKSVFALKNQNSGRFALVDNEGTVLAISDNTELPVVLLAEDLPDVGSKVNNKNLLALNLINGVNKMYQISTGTIETDTLLVDLPGGIRVIFPLVGADEDILLGSLRLVYSNIQNVGEGKSYSQIDLRYENPVLR